MVREDGFRHRGTCPVRRGKRGRFRARDGVRRMRIRITHRGNPAPTNLLKAGVVMSEGWFRRLRSGGVGLAFALGLLTAGLFHLPFQSTAQSTAQQQAVAAPAKNLPASAASLQNLSEAFASVAEHVKP